MSTDGRTEVSGSVGDEQLVGAFSRPPVKGENVFVARAIDPDADIPRQFDGNAHGPFAISLGAVYEGHRHEDVAMERRFFGLLDGWPVSEREGRRLGEPYTRFENETTNEIFCVTPTTSHGRQPIAHLDGPGKSEGVDLALSKRLLQTPGPNGDGAHPPPDPLLLNDEVDLELTA